MVVTSTGRFGEDSEHCSREDRVCLVCMSGSQSLLKTNTIFCLT